MILNKNYIKFNITNFTKRIIIFLFLLKIFIFILLIKLYFMQIINFNDYYNKSYKNCTRLIKLYPKRGFIFDRNGIVLAKNNTLYEFKILKHKNFKFLISKFLLLIKLDKDDINKIFLFEKENKYNYIILKKKFNKSEILNFLVNKFFFPNIKIKKIYIRNYPFNSLMSHSIGYISKISKKDLNLLSKKKNKNYSIIDKLGKVGIEKKYEKYLKGKCGFKEIKINNLGKKIKLNKIKFPIHGNDIYLSVDINLSKYINDLIDKSKAAVIVSDIKNGEILSIISNPSYNLNDFSNGISIKEYNKIILDKNYPLLNRCTQGIYSPASTIKPYISLFSLSDNYINKEYLIFDKSLWFIPNLYKSYRDWNKNGRGWINLSNAIEESSDIYFYNLAYQLGINNIYKYMSYFNFDKKTNIDIEESIGNLPNDKWKKNKFNKKWYIGDTISVGIGQGYWNSTPIQMSNALVSFINNGVIKHPHLLKYIYNYKLKKKIFFKKKIYMMKKKINTKHWNFIKKSMYKVAHHKNGTLNKYFKNSKYKVAAKSGTAQLYSIKENEEYNINKIPLNLRDHKLISAYAPYNNPEFSIFIILENGGFNKFNIGEITKKIFDYLILNKNINN